MDKNIDIQVRLVSVEEVPLAALVMTEIYTNYEMNDAISVEEIEAFRQESDENYLRQQLLAGQLYLWGVFEDGKLRAVSGMTSAGELAMLYCSPQDEEIGYDLLLMEAMDAYRKRHQKVERHGSTANRRVMPVLGLFCVCFFACVVLIVGRKGTGAEAGANYATVEDGKEHEGEEIEREERLDIREEDEITLLPNNMGVELLIPEADVYVADDLEYSIAIEILDVPNEEEKGKYEFYINYPQITYADGRDVSSINQILKERAFVCADKLYPVPDEDFIYRSEYPAYIADYVDYEITYMSNELICVAYQEHYFTGDQILEYFDMRTCVIDLVTGEEYTIDEIITCDTRLTEMYYEKLIVANESFKQAVAFQKIHAGQTLEGEVVNDRFFSDFVVSKSGIEICLTYHYGYDGLFMTGWQDVEFSEQELENYRTDSRFWEIVDRE